MQLLRQQKKLQFAMTTDKKLQLLSKKTDKRLQLARTTDKNLQLVSKTADKNLQHVSKT